MQVASCNKIGRNMTVVEGTVVKEERREKRQKDENQ